MTNVHLPHTNPKLDRAKARLKEHIDQSAEKVKALVQLISETVIKDRLVQPVELNFDERTNSANNVSSDHEGLILRIDNDPNTYAMHRHALGQMASKVEIGMTYVNKLNVPSDGEWRRALLALNLNELFHKTPFPQPRGGGSLKFLLRFVGQELRGFQSRTYGRHLASTPMLRAFLESCREAGAKPADAMSTAVSYKLSAYLPHVYEPFPGEAVAVGVRWANSDFGAGRLSVSLCVLHIGRGTSAVLSDEFSRIHIGAIIQESDIELSAETEAKEVDAAASAIKDIVVGKLAADSVNGLLKAISNANDAQVDWTTLKGQLKQFLHQEELTTAEAILNGERTGSIDLPPPGTTAGGKPLPSKWWASNLVSWFASQVDDPDRKSDLQSEAAKFFETEKSRSGKKRK